MAKVGINGLQRCGWFTKEMEGATRVRKATQGVIVEESWGRYEVDFGDGRTRDVREDEIAKVLK